MTATDRRCALWYYRLYELQVLLHDSEEDAAEDAYQLWVDGAASILGVQHSDGSFVERDDWVMYKGLLDGDRLAEADPGPPVKYRVIRAPFDSVNSVTVSVPDTYPAWVGGNGKRRRNL
jgi:hypothetical protein